MQDQENDRLYDANGSFVEGRQTELVIQRFLEKSGLIVTGTKANQKDYDLVIIDPLKDAEFIAQIKSSKTRTPYVTCHNYQGLLAIAKEWGCEPLIVFSFTTKRQFVVFHAVSRLILYSNHEDPEYKTGNVLEQWQCWDKEK